MSSENWVQSMRFKCSPRLQTQIASFFDDIHDIAETVGITH